MAKDVETSNKDYNKFLATILKIPHSFSPEKYEECIKNNINVPHHLKDSNSCQSNFKSYTKDDGFGSVPYKTKQINKNSSNYISKKEYYNTKTMKKIVKEYGIGDEIFDYKCKTKRVFSQENSKYIENINNTSQILFTSNKKDGINLKESFDNQTLYNTGGFLGNNKKVEKNICQTSRDFNNSTLNSSHRGVKLSQLEYHFQNQVKRELNKSKKNIFLNSINSSMYSTINRIPYSLSLSTININSNRVMSPVYSPINAKNLFEIPEKSKINNSQFTSTILSNKTSNLDKTKISVNTNKKSGNNKITKNTFNSKVTKVNPNKIKL